MLKRFFQLGLKGAVAGETGADVLDQAVGSRLISPQLKYLRAGDRKDRRLVVTLTVLSTDNGRYPAPDHVQTLGQEFFLPVVVQ